MTRVVLSPHFDDAVLSAWTWLRGAQVVTVCSGDPPAGVRGGWDEIVGFPDGATAMAARRAEDARALALAGADGRHVGLLDAQYRPADDDGAELADALLAWLRDEVGAADELLAPAGLGDHPDHLLARRAAERFAAGAGAALWLYADVPYAARFGWPSWVTGDEAGHTAPERAWASRVGTDAAAGRGERRVHRLDASQRAAKRAAAQAYASQFDAIDGNGAGHLGPVVLGYEVLFRRP